MTPSRIQELNQLGQSVWYDSIRRGVITSGELQHLIDLGITGLTSNPTIFDKAIAESNDYDVALRALTAQGVRDPAVIFEELAIADIQAAADLLRPAYIASRGGDGFASYEVPPDLAHDTQGSIAAARRLFARLARPNVMIKIPATPEGIPAIETLTADGVNVNITLIFGLDRYREVIEAYLRGLERRLADGERVDSIASVASFFVSRIDTLTDRLLAARRETAASDVERARLRGLEGQAAIASARLAYQIFREAFGETGTGDRRWARLRAAGARVQRPLWASTSTKNPAYPDTYYVDALIGPDTVNTLPPQTIAAFNDHGTVQLTIGERLDAARGLFAKLAAVGVQIDAVTDQLVAEGVESFAKSYYSLLATIEDRCAVPAAAQAERSGAALGRSAAPVRRRLAALDTEGFTRRFWSHDADLWKPGDADHARVIGSRMGWLDSPELFRGRIAEISALVGEVRAAGFTHALLLGMGGSSLASHVLRSTFGVAAGYLDLAVLDSTHPAAVRAALERSDPAQTLYVVSSKSGTTTEVESFHRFFRERVRAVKGDRAGENFIAITDPGTPLEEIAHNENFRRLFLNPADIGGRSSVLSYFGLVPAALCGIDLGCLLGRAERMRRACGASVPPAESPGVWLGVVLGESARAKRDKLTFILSPAIAKFGLWAEQLIAESLGKEGRGILPVEGEPPAARAAEYGPDRLFVYLRVADDDNAATDALARRVERAGFPIVRLSLADLYDLGAEFFRWEVATAVAGAVIGVDPFDEPNVSESKRNTRNALEAYRSVGVLPEPSAIVGARRAVQLSEGRSEAAAALELLLGRARRGAYVALMAYLPQSPEADAIFQRVRRRIRAARGVPVTLGYGPRFLHSTGQLHKGGRNAGVFIQISDAGLADTPNPGAPYTFGALVSAQALGDLQALHDHGRRVLSISLGPDPVAGLQAFERAVGKALRALSGRR